MKSNRVLIAIGVVVATILATTTIAATQIQLPLLQQEVVAQNATTATNQTAAPPTNQTAAPPTNLTSSDIDPVRDSLITARESLRDGDTTAAYSAVDSADTVLFGLANDHGEQFKPLQDSIDNTRDALRNNDNAKAIQQLNTADVELLKITQQLPPGEEEEEGEEG